MWVLAGVCPCACVGCCHRACLQGTYAVPSPLTPPPPPSSGAIKAWLRMFDLSMWHSSAVLAPSCQLSA